MTTGWLEEGTRELEDFLRAKGWKYPETFGEIVGDPEFAFYTMGKEQLIKDVNQYLADGEENFCVVDVELLEEDPQNQRVDGTALRWKFTDVVV